MEFVEACARLRAGSIDKGQFEVASRTTRQKLARHLARKWRQPQWADIEDVEIDLLEAMIHSAFEFEPNKAANLGSSAGLDGYMVWNACDKAKKRIHKRRGASLSGNADANPSVFERPLSAFGKDGDEDDGEGAQERILARAATPPAQEEHLEKRESVARARAVCRTVREVVSIEVLAEVGSLDVAALRMYADPKLREACRVTSKKRALRVVVGAAISVAERLIA